MNQGGLKDLARVDQAGCQGAQADPIQVQVGPPGHRARRPRRLRSGAARPRQTAHARHIGSGRASAAGAPPARRETTAAELERARKALRRLRPDALRDGASLRRYRRRAAGTAAALHDNPGATAAAVHGIAAMPKIDLNPRPHTRKTQSAVKGDKSVLGILKQARAMLGFDFRVRQTQTTRGRRLRNRRTPGLGPAGPRQSLPYWSTIQPAIESE